MARHSATAILASTLVIAVAGGFYAYAETRGATAIPTSYGLQSVFLSANGLKDGADVRMAGVTVGFVTGITLDPKLFVTRVTFRIDDRYQLPEDTRLGIGSSGFTSANALLITPGRSSRLLQPGAVIHDTEEMASLEQQVSQYIFGTGGL
ncbi:MlaD family protein [Lichenicoccus sp.]|uniref:MlaD family protein n=1 Tax=Lichenicoccus sp. TaxID=2781899 RepID=UPI003D11CABC